MERICGNLRRHAEHVRDPTTWVSQRGPPVRMVRGCSSCVTGRTLLQAGIGNFSRARKRLVVVRDGPVQSAECLRIAEERVLFLKVERIRPVFVRSFDEPVVAAVHAG
jgi:hypothetical protein